jgi:hypothetical protein
MKGTQTIECDKDAERKRQEEWRRQYEQDQARRREAKRRGTMDVDSDEALCDEDFLAKLKAVDVGPSVCPPTLDGIRHENAASRPNSPTRTAWVSYELPEPTL